MSAASLGCKTTTALGCGKTVHYHCSPPHLCYTSLLCEGNVDRRLCFQQVCPELAANQLSLVVAQQSAQRHANNPVTGLQPGQRAAVLNWELFDFVLKSFCY